MKGGPALAAVALTALAASTGCEVEPVVVGSAAGVPHCVPDPGVAESGSIVMAQSVPTAQWLPCIREVPVGWTFSAFEPEAGGTRIGFASDRGGPHALTVHLRGSCDLAGTTEVPSEHRELRRYERVTRVLGGYGGERHYTFPGGCITYRFDVHGDGHAATVAGILEVLGFLSRTEVARQVHDSSDGRLELDREGQPP